MTDRRITITCRAEVKVPEEVYLAFGYTTEYSKVSAQAAKQVEACGQDACGSVYEWGESSSAGKCQIFLTVWDHAIANWQKRLSN